MPVTPLDISTHLVTSCLSAFFFICVPANIQPTHHCLQPSWLELILQLRFHETESSALLKSKYLSIPILRFLLVLYYLTFFPPLSLCLKLILCTKTSTALPCLDHFETVPVKGNLEGSVCPKPTQLRLCRTWNFSLLHSDCGELHQAFLPKSSLRLPVLSIILIQTARKHLLSIPYHTRSSRWSCDSTHWFLCQWEKSSSASSHHLVSVCAQTTKSRLLNSRRPFLKGSRNLNLYNLTAGH